MTTSTTDPGPLKYMGTQSQETVNMAAALARAVGSTEGRVDANVSTLSDEVDDASSKVGAAAAGPSARPRPRCSRPPIRFATGRRPPSPPTPGKIRSARS